MATKKAETPPKAATLPPLPVDVHEALRLARIELCGQGISKEGQAPAAVGGYKFRGIDDIYNVIGPLMAKYGIVMRPLVQDLTHNTYTNKQGRVTQHYIVRVRYVVSVNSDRADEVSVEVYGEAADTADKGMNKAMTSAYKNAVFQLFAPPLAGTPMDMDGGDTVPRDSEQDAPDVSGERTQLGEPPPERDPSRGTISAADAKAVQMALPNAGIEEAAFFAWLKLPKGAYDQIPMRRLPQINERLKELIREKSVAQAQAQAEQGADDDLPF